MFKNTDSHLTFVNSWIYQPIKIFCSDKEISFLFILAPIKSVTVDSVNKNG